MARPWRRIQNSIQVSTATATSAAMPSAVAWTISGSSSIVRTTASPIAIERARACCVGVGDAAGPHRDGGGSGAADADGMAGQRVAPADLDDVGRDDAHDE